MRKQVSAVKMNPTTLSQKHQTINMIYTFYLLCFFFFFFFASLRPENWKLFSGSAIRFWKNRKDQLRGQQTRHITLVKIQYILTQHIWYNNPFNNKCSDTHIIQQSIQQCQHPIHTHTTYMIQLSIQQWHPLAVTEPTR